MRLPGWLRTAAPLLPESEAVVRRRRRVVAGVALGGASLLGVSLSTRPGSARFYGLTLGVAATWIAGSVASGPLHRGWNEKKHRPVVTPVLTGAAAFGLFYVGALVSRNIPVLDRAIGGVLSYAHQGQDSLVLLTTLANGAAEEVFFRGALYTATEGHRPVLLSTGIYALATAATRNPALVLASVPMGALFAVQRRTSGGIQAPMLTHLTWSALMLKFLPPLFADHAGKTA